VVVGKNTKGVVAAKVCLLREAISIKNSCYLNVKRKIGIIKMIITIKLEGAYGSFDENSLEWYRLIEIEENTNFEDLHLAIQSSVKFENDHLYEFFIANTCRSRDRSRFDDENGGLNKFGIGDVFPLSKHKKLFYLFDYGDSWYFRISKVRKKPILKEDGVIYPRIIEIVGENPDQYPEH